MDVNRPGAGGAEPPVLRLGRAAEDADRHVAGRRRLAPDPHGVRYSRYSAFESSSRSLVDKTNRYYEKSVSVGTVLASGCSDPVFLPDVWWLALRTPNVEGSLIWIVEYESRGIANLHHIPCQRGRVQPARKPRGDDET